MGAQRIRSPHSNGSIVPCLNPSFTIFAEAQFDPELASAFREKWVIPRRKMALAYFKEGIKNGFLRPDIDLNSMIDLLYAPLYFQLQMGLTTLSDAYIDNIFDHTMEGCLKRT
jgi:Tetracyclin repressor-like, C-terminal domain